MRKRDFNGVSDDDVLEACKMFVNRVRDNNARWEDAMRQVLWEFARTRWHDANKVKPDSDRTVIALDNRGKPWLASYEPTYWNDVYEDEPDLLATCAPAKDSPLYNWQLAGLCNGEGLSITKWREIDDPNE